jgi:radical SAM protein with 4Fe4S-binding SPASM domain
VSMSVENNPKYVQEPPNCLQIELTEGCQLACFFCGIQSIRENGADGQKRITGKGSGPFKYLTVERAEEIASRIAYARDNHGWNPRLEFALHGEPTHNPNFIQILGIFRKHLPATSLMLTSNGGGLLRSPGITANINALMEAGLNVLLLDNYEGVRIVDKVRERYEGPYPVYDYPSDHRANPHKRRRPTEHDIVVVADIVGANDGNHATLNNHSGGAAPLNDRAAGKRCAKPFRELSIRWDGNVALCCNDWPGVYKVGNVLETQIEELWQSEPFMAARKFLVRGERVLPPCRGCDALSYRTGLLPDRLGKQSLPEPTEADEAVWVAATSGAPYTPRVKRPWDTE